MRPDNIYDCFIPECNLDTALVEVLLNRSNSVNHSKGNNSVAVKMKEDKMVGAFAVGIIDKDKIPLKELGEFEENERLSKKCLRFFVHPLKQHYIVQICPAIESWILNECKKGNISPSKHKLPNDIKGMRKLKSKAQRDDARFKRLFNEMLANDACDEIRELQRWLHFLEENNYDTNIDLL